MSDFYGVGSGDSGSFFNSYFGTSGTNQSSSSNTLGDYGLIQSGAYRKLLNSYYGTKKSTSGYGNEESDEVKTNKKSLTLIKSTGKSLNDAAKALVNLDEEALEDRDGISKKAESFVKAYNDLIDSAGESDSKSILNKTLWMIGSTNTNSSLLNSVGISIGTDNKLSFNAESFKKADISAIKTLFGTNSSYMGRIAGKATDLVNLSNNALNSVSKASTYTNKGDFSSVNSSTLYDDLI